MADKKDDLQDPANVSTLEQENDIEELLASIARHSIRKNIVGQTSNDDISKLNWGHRQRLKDKFLNSPRRALQDYEILEMILFYIIPRRDTKPIAKMLLNKFGSLAGIIFADDSALESIKGVGDGVVLYIKLCADLFSRISIPKQKGEVNILSSWLAVINYCQLTMGFKKSEAFRVLMLNKKNILIGDEFVDAGTVDKIAIYPREVSKMALLHGATAIILVHNHPSGDSTPSREDIEITKRIIDALAPINVSMHDHIIVAEHKHFSFKASGLI